MTLKKSTIDRKEKITKKVKDSNIKNIDEDTVDSDTEILTTSGKSKTRSAIFDTDMAVDLSNIFGWSDMIVVRKQTEHVIKHVRDRNQTTWVDKHRPKTLKEIIGHDDVKNMLITSIEKGDLPHLLFHGGSGTGKTSTVLALVMQLYGPNRVHEKVLELNASDENGINVVRDKIIKFASIVVGSADPKYPSPAFKIVILDEADSMTSEAQTALKKVMESTCDITRFVFICNYESKIIDAIKSRCASFRFNPIPDDLMIDKLRKIAETEKMKVDDNVFQVITDICEGDARRAINTLQNIKYIPQFESKTITKEDIYDMTSYMEKTYLNQYWIKITTANVSELRKIARDITNTGYPMNYVLNCIKDKVLESKLSDIQKSDIFIHLGKLERMITSGADNWIQLLSMLAHINSMYRKIEVETPLIY